ncbi:MAG: hypothetical protein QF437_23890 [Planctomycetota bacterium]|nr:hypothetical protein [Planctomycetota bacterium]MDP7255092.1 hypothetical protein [Planctomycetota bacterium]
MKPIIIGAGRGTRLNAITENQPKCYAPIGRGGDGNIARICFGGRDARPTFPVSY